MATACLKKDMKRLLDHHHLPPCHADTATRFQTRPGVFKIPFFRRWIVLAAGPELAEDIRKAPDSVLDMLTPIYDVRIAPYSRLVFNYDLLRFFNTNTPSSY
jgi:hypothetical protein